LKLLPKTINVKEVYVPKIEKKKDEETQAGEDENEINATQIVLDGTIYLLIFLGVCLVIFLLAPITYHKIWLSKASRNGAPDQQATAIYKHTHFILNQMGISRSNITPMNYALDIIDPKFKTQLAAFIEVYLKIKYSKEALTAEEFKLIEDFYPAFKQTILGQYSNSERFFNFLKPHRWVHYLINLNLSK